MNKWFVIFNPKAGLKKNKKIFSKIVLLLNEAGLEFTFKFTKHPEHATELTFKSIEKGYRKFIVVGGDGTFNECVNGIMLQKFCSSSDISLAMIPMGSGNDWVKSYDIPEIPSIAADIIKKETTFLQDVGLARYFVDGVKKERYFANMAGLGFDAFVTARTNNWKEKGLRGKMLYSIALASSLASYSSKKVSVNIDGGLTNHKMFSTSVAICKYNGGGMMQAPNAISNDGFFDITIIEKITKSQIIKNIKNLFDGSFINHPKVKSYRGEKVGITSNKKVLLEIDGESLGNGPFEFEIIKQALKVVIYKLN